MATRSVFADPIEAPDLATKIVAKDGTDDAGYVTVEDVVNFAGTANVTATGGSEARTIADHFGSYINVLDYGPPPDGVSDDAPKFNAALAAARSLGRNVYVPMPPVGVYCFATQVEIAGFTASPLYAPFAIIGDGMWCRIKAIAPMQSLFKVSGRYTTIKDLNLDAGAGSLATNGIVLDFAGAPNDDYWTRIEGMLIAGFSGAGILNINGNGWHIFKCFFQANGYDIRSLTHGLNSSIDGCTGLFAGTGVSFEGVTIEGVRIVNSMFLSSSGRGIYIEQALACAIDNCIIDQCDTGALIVNGDAHGGIGSLMVTNSWFGAKAGAVGPYGVSISGNCSAVRFVNCDFAGWPLAGLALLSTAASAPASVHIEGSRFLTNGNGSVGSADFLTETSLNAIVAVTCRDNYFSSMTANIKSIIEGNTTVGLYTGNRFNAAITPSPKSIYYHNFGGDVAIPAGPVGVGFPGFMGYSNNSCSLGCTPTGANQAVLVSNGLGTANYIMLMSTISTQPVIYTCEGVDANINIRILPKGTGNVVIDVPNVPAFADDAAAAAGGVVVGGVYRTASALKIRAA